MPQVCLQLVIVVFPEHTHFYFFYNDSSQEHMLEIKISPFEPVCEHLCFTLILSCSCSHKHSLSFGMINFTVEKVSEYDQEIPQ